MSNQKTLLPSLTIKCDEASRILTGAHVSCNGQVLDIRHNYISLIRELSWFSHCGPTSLIVQKGYKNLSVEERDYLNFAGIETVQVGPKGRYEAVHEMQILDFYTVPPSPAPQRPPFIR